jgi:hypothetical protein
MDVEKQSDALTASHVGWLHIWRISKRERMTKVRPTIPDEAVLARKYFSGSQYAQSVRQQGNND